MITALRSRLECSGKLPWSERHASGVIAPEARDEVTMEIFVYGAGYGTVSPHAWRILERRSCAAIIRRQDLNLRRGALAFYEKNLEDITRRNVRAGRLTY